MFKIICLIYSIIIEIIICFFLGLTAVSPFWIFMLVFYAEGIYVITDYIYNILEEA